MGPGKKPDDEIIAEIRNYEAGLRGKQLKTFKSAFTRMRATEGVRSSFMIARMAVEGG